MTEPDHGLEALLVYLKDARGFDFTGYKRSTLSRRLTRRMHDLDIARYDDYLDYLEVQPDEFTILFNTILINVTSFFRDPDSWRYLQDNVLVPILEAKSPDAGIRVWSAGCASGQEAYTVAIALAEILGPDAFRRRVKIYATDVDEEALSYARLGSFLSREVENVSPELLDRYFETVGERHVFRKDLRRSVIFGRNDLVHDAPISRNDLVLCRNTLMYFNLEVQSRILGRLHFALADNGVLFLGRAEMLLRHGRLFVAEDLKQRIFRRVPSTGGPEALTGPDYPVQRTVANAIDRLRSESFLANPLAQVVVSADGLVALSNRRAEELFGITSRDVGRPFRDLDLARRRWDLIRHVEQAQSELRANRVPDIEVSQATEGNVRLDVEVQPLLGGAGGVPAVVISFHDVTGARLLYDELELANRQLEATYEELQSSNEELETTNEELQSTVEELETMNEELQSTNEQLETMNEELQSTNYELQHVNHRLQESGASLDTANAFLGAVLSSFRSSVIVVDRDLLVQVWNTRAENLWGLRTQEAVGQHLLGLDIGLSTELLRPLVRGALQDGLDCAPIEAPAVNRRGRSVTVRVVCTPLRASDAAEVVGAILVMDQLVPDQAPAGDAPSCLGG